MKRRTHAIALTDGIETYSGEEMTAIRVLTQNARSVFRRLRREGTTGLSVECAKQLVPTTGLVCSVAAYERAILVAAKTAGEMVGLDIWGGE